MLLKWRWGGGGPLTVHKEPGLKSGVGRGRNVTDVTERASVKISLWSERHGRDGAHLRSYTKSGAVLRLGDASRRDESKEEYR